MELNKYQELAMRTAGPVDKEEMYQFMAMAIGGEVGELQNYIKKGLYHGHSINNLVIQDELGDIMWYLARACDLMGITLEDVAQYNIRKLALRYPDTFFSELSINRRENGPSNDDPSANPMGNTTAGET